MKRLSVDEKNICVNLEMDVTGVVEYSSRYYWGTNPRNDRYQVLFQVGGLFFEYSRWGSYSGTGTSLYEISEEAIGRRLFKMSRKFRAEHSMTAKRFIRWLKRQKSI